MNKKADDKQANKKGNQKGTEKDKKGDDKLEEKSIAESEEQTVQSKVNELTYLWMQICENERIIEVPELLQVQYQETFEPTFQTQTKDFYIWECAYEARKTIEYFRRPKLFVGFMNPEIIAEEVDPEDEEEEEEEEADDESDGEDGPDDEEEESESEDLVEEEENQDEDQEVPVVLDVQGIVTELPLVRAICRMVTLIARTLKVLKLIDCSLGSATVSILASGIRKEKCIQYLYLDRNPTNLPQNFHEVVNNNFRLKLLSLKYCDIDDMGALNLAEQLSWKDIPRQYLLTLDLTGNNIGSKGAKRLADALRWNRTLKRLILTGNKISSNGAQQLASIFMPFLLTKQENQLRQTRYWKRMKTLNLCISDRMDKLVKAMFRNWIVDKSENANTYNDYQQKLFDFRVRSELMDIFGRNLVAAMENYSTCKPDGKNEDMEFIGLLLSDADRAKNRISSGMDTSDAGSRSSATENIPPELDRGDLPEIEVPEVKEKEDRRRHSAYATSKTKFSRKSFKTGKKKHKAIEQETEVGLQDDEVAELKEMLTNEICRDCSHIVSDVHSAPVDSSDMEKCSVTSTSDTPDSTSTWSSYGMLPGRAADDSEFEDLSEAEFKQVYCDVKEIIEYINTPDVNKGELFEHEVCMVYKKLYSEAEKIVPKDLHPLMKDVKESYAESWCCGNYVLKHLNISHNKVGKKGLKQFLKAFEYRNQHERLKNKMVEFIFAGNRLDDTHPLYKQLESLTKAWPTQDINNNLKKGKT